VGQLVRLDLPKERTEARTAGRESAAELAVSLTPGSFAVHGEADRVVVHSLLPGEPSLARTVAR
jgi:hypothetical protein